MTIEIKACPKQWRKCHPHHCNFTPNGNATKTQPPPSKPGPSGGGQITQPSYNVVYLVDEHEVNDVNQQVDRNDTRTLRRRYAWYHDKANLETFNVPEIPITIDLPPEVSDPLKNRNFRWEGFMFDIPGDRNAVRVGIVAGANTASNDSLNANLGGHVVDRVVGFAASYADPAIPIGPIVQVRRDDTYRLLGASVQSGLKVAWRLAYYITKATPRTNTSHSGLPAPLSRISSFADTDRERGPDEPGPEDAPLNHDKDSDAYDQLLDQNVADDVAVVEGGDSWGGQLYSISSTFDIPLTPDDNEGGVQPGDGA